MKKCYIIIAFLIIGLFSYSQPKLYAPVLVTPVEGAIGQMPNQLLDWDPVSGTIGIHYEVEIDSSDTFDNAVSYLTEFSSMRPSELLFGQTYYWRVRAIDDDGISSWSDTWSFEVVITIVLKSPTNNAINQAPNATIKWSHATSNPLIGFRGVSFIDYQLDTVASFDSPLAASIKSVPNPDTTFTDLSNLLFGTQYYWRMRLRNSNDTSIWSDYKAFTTIGIVTLKNPDDGAVDQDPLLTLEWSPISGLSKFAVILADNPDFTLASTVETTKTKITTDTLQFGKTYYWKVSAIHPLDMITSSVAEFTTLDKVTLTAPANNQTGVQSNPTFKWTAVTGTVSYDLWLANSSSFEDAKKYKIINTNSGSDEEQFPLPSNILEDGNTYFWRVQAILPNDTSNWSDTFSFRVTAEGIGTSVASKSAMSVYPNPAKDRIHVNISTMERAKFRLSISNLLGNIMISDEMQFENGRSVTDLVVNSLPNGVYFVKIQKVSASFMSKLIIDR